MGEDTTYHSPLGGSSAKRFLACGFSYIQQTRSAKEPENPSSFANLGTFAHEIGAKCIEHDLEPLNYVGESQTVDNGQGETTFVVGKDISLNALSTYTNECQKLKATATSFYFETFISASELHPLLAGTVDFCAFSQDTIYIRDYKNGAGVPVSSYKNEQLMYYAFLAFSKLTQFSTAIINMAIVQPNVHGDFYEIKPWVISAEELKDWGHNTLLPRMRELTSGADFEPVAGSHCQFCPVILECPVVRDCYHEFSDFKGDTDMLSTDEIDELYRKRDSVKKMLTALDKSMHARLTNGEPVRAAKLVDKKSFRKWLPGAEDILKSKLGNEAYAPLTLKSPAIMEKISPVAYELSQKYSYTPTSNEKVVVPVDKEYANPETPGSTFKEYLDKLRNA